MGPISIRKAIIIGTLFVNIPVLPLMFTPVAIFVFLLGPEANQRVTSSVLLSMFEFFLLGFVCAWSWWSFMVPHWRLWAWQRVEDISGLKTQAIKAGLIWPDGHFFEKTELRSKAIQAKLMEIESQKSSHA